MPTATQPEQPVTRQQDALSEDALRFGVAVPVVAAALNGWSPESVRKAADKSVADRVLDRFKSPGDGRAAYYALAPGAAARLGVKPPPAAGYPKRGLVHRLCVLLYTAKTGYAKITPAEFSRHFPSLAWAKANLSHYVADLADPESPRLGWVIVDDGDRDPRRLASKVCEEYRKRFEHREWREHWILPGRFFVAVVTAGPKAKADLIQAAVRERRPRFAATEVVSLAPEFACLPFNLV